MLTSALRLLLSHSPRPFVFTNSREFVFDYGDLVPGIYIHMPFCSSLCPFCPYCRELFASQRAMSFNKALLQEIKLVAAAVGKKQKIESVYFGGGTPSLMAEDIPSIMETVRANFTVCGEIGVEVKPSDVNDKLVGLLKEAGVTMVSLGVQSFRAASRNILGLNTHDAQDSIRTCRQAGFKSVDVDLIFGIPEQKENDIREDFLKAADAGATQISAYPFIDFSYAQNKKKPEGRGKKKRLLNVLLETAAGSGFERSSVWTFARKGFPRYSSVTRDSFIGLGPSATSVSRDMCKINTFSTDEYTACLQRGEIPTALTLEFTDRRRALYWLFWNSYCLELKAENFRSLFGKELEEVFKWELSAGIMSGLLKKEADNYILTDKGAYLFHLLEQQYTHQYIDKTWHTCRQEPWPQKISLY